MEHGRNTEPTEVQPSRSLAERGIANTPRRVGNCREGISVVACISADGKNIPPLCIVKGKTSNTSMGPEGAKYSYQSRGWMEDVLGE